MEHSQATRQQSTTAALPFHVVAGKNTDEGENVKYADAFATFAEAVEAYDGCTRSHFARIELDQYSIGGHGFESSFNDNLFHVTAGTAHPAHVKASSLDYSITAQRLTSDLITFLVVNGVDWIHIVYNGRLFHVNVPWEDFA